MEGSNEAQVAVIGAGSSGLAMLKALRDQELTAECFERGSDVGGLWRHENDNGLSGAYASLRTNVSRARMEYPGFPMPDSYPDFPHHSEMAAYLRAYADAFGLRAWIRFGTSVERLERDPGGRWGVTLADGSRRSFRAVVVAIGLFWCPGLPTCPGRFNGTVSHSSEYRTPEPFAGRRVLVVGGGQSAAEIAVEVATVAERTLMSVRGGVHVIPRWIGRRPYDAADIAPLNRLPWGLLNRIYSARVARTLGPAPSAWPAPARRLLEGIPVVSSDLLPALRRGDVVARPGIDRLLADRVRFDDGSEEPIDHIVYATGYRISVPFLASSLAAINGRRLRLYRRIVPPAVDGLYFAGFVDAPGGLLPVVEAQSRWIAAVLRGRLLLPPAERMHRAIERAERRTRQRFPTENPDSIRCDPHAYRRLLESDLRRARLRVWPRADLPGRGGSSVIAPDRLPAAAALRGSRHAV
jgi:cation diffusion facilitator CzcD-associated flavoprotein CzcO